jgi:uncharacterized membrane protein
MSSRTAAWLAWSLVGFSVALIVGGIALDRTLGSTDPEPPYGGALDAFFTLTTFLPFSIVGAIVAFRHPRNTIGWIFCATGFAVGLTTLAGATLIFG